MRTLAEVASGFGELVGVVARILVAGACSVTVEPLPANTENRGAAAGRSGTRKDAVTVSGLPFGTVNGGDLTGCSSR